MATKGRRLSKQQEVAYLSERFSAYDSGFLLDYRGLDVEALSALRNQLRQKDTELRVIKNTLARRAAQGTPFAALEGDFVGPNALAIVQGDPAAAASVIVDFAKEHELLEIKVGLLGGETLGADQIEALAALPSPEQLRAMMLGALGAVPGGFVRTLAAVPQTFLRLLQARADDLGDGSS